MTTSPRPPQPGGNVLRQPYLNKGSAFSAAERRALGIEGLLPPVPSTLEIQIARIHMQLSLLENDLQKYLLLSDLQSRNETLFYAVLMSDPATFMPLVYTPTVGEACQKFDHFLRAARGLYLPISAKGRLHELLGNWPEKNVRFIVVTDGERILGLGDLGVGGMGIPIGKLSLYTACAGVHPRLTLPITLDVGTNNEALLEDPLYLGLRQQRVRGADYDAFIDEFVQTVQKLYPKCCIQWEDFANFNAVPILARYRDKICTYNDDIQGTAAVALAGIFGALRISKQKLTDQRFLFLGGGSAATGIAELISEAMALEGLPVDKARGRNCLAVRRWWPDHRLAQRPGRFPKAVRPPARAHKLLCGGHRNTQAHRHHRRQHCAEVVQSAGHRGDGADQRTSDHLSLFEPDLALGMHGGRSLQMVEWPGDLCQRQPVSAGRILRSDIHSRPRQQRLYLSRDGHGRAGYRGPPRHPEHVRFCAGRRQWPSR